MQRGDGRTALQRMIDGKTLPPDLAEYASHVLRSQRDTGHGPLRELLKPA